jgi:hypothetical protein
LTDAIRMMDIAGKKWNKFEKMTILQFDEMQVTYGYEIDKKTDSVVGPHEKLQVIMARGLFSKFKQPIYCEFDTNITPDILMQVIKQLHNIGYTVAGIVSDNASTNTKCLNELGKLFFILLFYLRVKFSVN